MRTVTIFGSSLPVEASAIYREGRLLGRWLAENGLAVCNGGYGGLMEASARGAREAAGHTIGVTCAIWTSPPNPWIVEEVRTATFLERLLALIERGDAYIVLPGGTGTLAELAMVWEMMNKAVLSTTAGGRKPLVLVGSYWQPVVDCVNREGSLLFPEAAHRSAAIDLITLARDAREAVDELRRLSVLGSR